MDGLNIQNIYKSYGDTRALIDVSFDVSAGEIVAVLGPSGCGKSTLLSLIAGLEKPNQGEICWNGDNLEDIQPHKRGFGLMFQDFALFPHRDVFGNVAFGLQMTGTPKEQVEKRVAEVLELVGLRDFGKRSISTLSGGEGQRVALARSLAPNPRLLMLDEPLGSLDKSLRERLINDLRQILKDCQQTALYVTHDQEEAFVVADRVVVMSIARVEQIGSPRQIYQHPSSSFTAHFLGLKNLFHGDIRVEPSGSTVVTPIGIYPVQHQTPGEVTVLLRPDRVKINSTDQSLIWGEIKECAFKGALCRIEIQVNELMLAFDIPSNTTIPEPGQMVHLAFNPDDALQIFPTEK